MTKSIGELCFDAHVGVAKMPAAEYPAESDVTENPLTDALRSVAHTLGWTADVGRGAFADVIPAGAKVLIKPNLVRHENQGPWGMLPLVTHQSLIRAVAAEALRADAKEVLVGDAPIQECDFEVMIRRMDLDSWSAKLTNDDARFKGVRDFRRTTSTRVDGVRVATENRQPEELFTLFDLGGDSLLEPITDDKKSFRITCYDPRLLAKTHAPGRHQYLVARDVMEADVVINLPKLKTHKKAGVTCALKNLIGINGNKEYLPHHRIGGSGTGGDCYQGGGRIKSTLEYLADQENTAASLTAAKFWHGLSLPLYRTLRLLGESLDLEGSWSGNDTIWRTCLDLNRILLYGRPDGTLAAEPQRRVLHVVDAVVAGQGNGPLAPQPLSMGLLIGGSNAAAVDWVGAILLGFDPKRIAIVREAFGDFSRPVTKFTPEQIVLRGDLGTGPVEKLLAEPKLTEPIIYPVGWRDAATEPAA